MRQFKAITRHGRIVKRNSNNHWATLRPVDWLDQHPIHLHKKPEITMAAGSMVCYYPGHCIKDAREHFDCRTLPQQST